MQEVVKKIEELSRIFSTEAEIARQMNFLDKREKVSLQ